MAGAPWGIFPLCSAASYRKDRPPAAHRFLSLKKMAWGLSPHSRKENTKIDIPGMEKPIGSSILTPRRSRRLRRLTQISKSETSKTILCPLNLSSTLGFNLRKCQHRFNISQNHRHIISHFFLLMMSEPTLVPQG